MWLALGLAVLVSAASWPGFMSFDSVLALSQARRGITESGYPPMVSYVWWLADRVIPGSGGMLLLQNLLVFLGMAKIALEVRAPRPVAMAVLLLVAVAPVTLGPMLVVWKDVAFAGWLALATGFALAYWQRYRRGDLWLALVLCAIACTYRINALPGVVPVLALLGDGLACRRLGRGRPLARLAMAAATTAICSVAMFGLVWELSSHRLPDGGRLTPPHGHHPWTMAGDLVGISVCSGSSVLPDVLFPAGREGDRDFLRRAYAPEHSQKTFATQVDGQTLAGDRIGQVRDLQSRWWAAVRARPGCFFWHRWQVSTYLLGLNPGPVFYLTDAGVVTNDLGLKAHFSRLTRLALAWIGRGSEGPLARTWCYLLVAIGALGVVAVRRRNTLVPLALLASAVLYLAAGALILPAADARYQFWVVLACLATAMAAAGARDGGAGQDSK